MIFVSFIFWSWVLGAIGVILAVPPTIMLEKIWEITGKPQTNSATASAQEIS
jgi:predicted PurR-regulated permease PerM